MPRELRARRTILAVLLVALLGYAGSYIPSGYFAFFPGDAIAVAPLVKVEGGTTSAKGAFLLTTISAREANVYTYLYALMDSRVSLRTREEYLPRGMDIKEYNQYSQRLMDESQAVAAVLGLRAAGVDARFTGHGTKVVEVMTDGPAQGKLNPGDVILSVNGEPTSISDDLTSLMAKIPVGASVRLQVLRGAQRLDVPLTTVEHPTQKGRSAIRIRIETHNPTYEASVKVTIDAGNITGPSAGLMFTLEVMNQAMPHLDLTHGRRIAGTGTVSPSGRIGPVGGVTQKVVAAERAGAQYFLVPKDNEAEADRAARRIRVVGVESLDQAVKFLSGISSVSQSLMCVGLYLDI